MHKKTALLLSPKRWDRCFLIDLRAVEIIFLLCLDINTPANLKMLWKRQRCSPKRRRPMCHLPGKAALFFLLVFCDLGCSLFVIHFKKFNLIIFFSMHQSGLFDSSFPLYIFFLCVALRSQGSLYFDLQVLYELISRFNMMHFCHFKI